MKAIRQFHEKQEVKRSLNATYVALTLKKTGATELRDFGQ